MPQWTVDLFGQSLAPIIWVAIVAVVVCCLAVAAITVAKKAFGGNVGIGPKGRGPRLAVQDVARVDEKRRLVLVRRDDVEHLVLVGGQNDLLVESNILRVPAATSGMSMPDTRLDPALNEPRIERDHRGVQADPRALEPAPIAVAPAPRPAPVQAPAPAAAQPGQRRQDPVLEAPVADRRPAAPAPTQRVQPETRSQQPIAPQPPQPSQRQDPQNQMFASAARTQSQSAAQADQLRARMPAETTRAIPAPQAGSSIQPVRPEPSAVRAPQPPVAAPALPQEDETDMARSSLGTRTFSRATPTTSPLRPASPAPAPSLTPEPRGSGDKPEEATPSPAPDRAAEDLRATMNSSQSKDFTKVQDATSSASEGPNEATPVRQPLSVKSFATAIQNRKAPAEAPVAPPAPTSAEATDAPVSPTTAQRQPSRIPSDQPQTVRPPQPVATPPIQTKQDERPAASPAPTRPTRPNPDPMAQREPEEAPRATAAKNTPARPTTMPSSAASQAPAIRQPAASAAPDPSLEDFLSAELDSDFGNDSFFQEDERPSADQEAELRRPASEEVASPSLFARSAAAKPASALVPPVGSPREDGSTTAKQEAPVIEAPRRDENAPLPSSTSEKNAAAASAPPAPDRAPTIEEEMERLLGDFSFSDERVRPGEQGDKR